jgi:chemotaxis response regulator CheB
MVEVFIYETRQFLEQLEQRALASEDSGSFQPEDVNEIFRAMHTIKGSAAMMMFDEISHLAYAVEDVLFQSVAVAAGKAALGVILTGMGNDGGHGLLAMRKHGADTLGQDEQSSVVYGMPRVAYELGAVRRQLPLSVIAPTIMGLTQHSQQEGGHAHDQ